MTAAQRSYRNGTATALVAHDFEPPSLRLIVGKRSLPGVEADGLGPALAYSAEPWTDAHQMILMREVVEVAE